MNVPTSRLLFRTWVLLTSALMIIASPSVASATHSYCIATTSDGVQFGYSCPHAPESTEPTPIDGKYADLGGEGGFLGAPLSFEGDMTGGRVRHYERGSIYWSTATGAHEIHDPTRSHWFGLTWQVRVALGFLTTDEHATANGVGRVNHFQGGSIFSTPTTGIREVVGPIRDRWAATGWENGLLGFPTTGEHATNNGLGRLNHFQGGSIFFTPETGAHEVRGEIRRAWEYVWWESGPLGFPTTGQHATTNGLGQVSHFQGGSIFSTRRTGAQAVWGPMRDAWAQTGWENGPLGFPTTPRWETPNRLGHVTHFQGGSIFSTTSTGAHAVRGPIRDAWARAGWENGPMGFPSTGQLPTPNGLGQVNHFQGGSVFFTERTGAHAVRGPIRDRWASTGWENGRLGFPTSDEYAVAEGLRMDFAGGRITWNTTTGVTTVSP